MKRICFGNLFLGIKVNSDKSAYMEILDTKTTAKFMVNIDTNGVSRFSHYTPKNIEIKKKIPIKKALKRLYDIYDNRVKEIA